MISTIRFPAGLPGFPGDRSFSVEAVPGIPLAWLVSEDQVGPTFLVLTEPARCFPDLPPLELDEEDEALLEASGPEDLVAWLILTVRPGRVTANLLGPLVVNLSSGIAVQAVRDDRRFPVAAPLIAAEVVTC